MSRLLPLVALLLPLAVACGGSDDASGGAGPSLLASVAGAASTTTVDIRPYEPVVVPFASRAWLNRADGSLVVESCEAVDAFVAEGHTLDEVVEYRSYACGPTVTAKVVDGDRSVADLFTRR